MKKFFVWILMINLVLLLSGCCPCMSPEKDKPVDTQEESQEALPE